MHGPRAFASKVGPRSSFATLDWEPPLFQTLVENARSVYCDARVVVADLLLRVRRALSLCGGSDDMTLPWRFVVRSFLIERLFVALSLASSRRHANYKDLVAGAQQY